MVTITKNDIYRVLIRFYEGNRYNIFIVDDAASLILFTFWVMSNLVVLNLAFVGGYYLEDSKLVDPTMNMLLELGFDIARLIFVMILIIVVVTSICYMIGHSAKRKDAAISDWDNIK